MQTIIEFLDHSAERQRNKLKWVTIFAIGLIGFLALGALCLVKAEAIGEEIRINLDILSFIESSNNPLAYNKISQARGIFQITPICLKDYNNENRTKIALQSLFDPQIAELVAKWYLETRIPFFLQNKGIPITIANVLWAYNAGIGNVVKGIKPKETKDYIKKYYQLAQAK